MRTRFAFTLAAVVVAGLMLVSRSGAEPKEAPKANATGAGGTPGEYTLGPERVITMPAMSYFCTTYQTTFAEMDRVHGEIEELFKTIGENKIEMNGTVMFIYKGVQQDMTKPFTLSVGVLVPAGTKAAGKYEVKDLPAFKCSAALLNGSLASLEQAYPRHYGEVIAGGNTPTDEARELYVYWEGPESNNNVVWLQAGIE